MDQKRGQSWPQSWSAWQRFHSIHSIQFCIHCIVSFADWCTMNSRVCETSLEHLLNETRNDSDPFRTDIYIPSDFSVRGKQLIRSNENHSYLLAIRVIIYRGRKHERQYKHEFGVNETLSEFYSNELRAVSRTSLKQCTLFTIFRFL